MLPIFKKNLDNSWNRKYNSDHCTILHVLESMSDPSHEFCC
jgi:hypothetical protein